MSASLPVESAACLVVAAVFKTVEGQSVLGGFNSFPLRQFITPWGIERFLSTRALFPGARGDAQKCAQTALRLVTL